MLRLPLLFQDLTTIIPAPEVNAHLQRDGNGNDNQAPEGMLSFAAFCEEK